MTPEVKTRLWNLKGPGISRHVSVLRESLTSHDLDERAFAAAILLAECVRDDSGKTQSVFVEYISAESTGDPLVDLVVCEALQYTRLPEEALPAVLGYLRRMSESSSQLTASLATSCLNKRNRPDWDRDAD